MTQTVTPTDPDSLPQYKGKPVPWITRWSGEINSDKLTISTDVQTGDIHLNYEGGNEDRDEYGVLWKREGIMRNGRPNYSEINAYRQRSAMRRRLCQVCGSKIEERPIRWLISDAQLHQTSEGTFTISAPTCTPCIPLALDLCPHLKEPGMAKVIKVLDYEPWGVYGEAIALDRASERVKDMRGVYVRYENPPIPLTQVAAFQTVVQLTKFVIVPAGDPEGFGV